MNSRVLVASTKLADWRIHDFHSSWVEVASWPAAVVSLWCLSYRCSDAALDSTYELLWVLVRTG